MADANDLEDDQHKWLVIENQSNADIILYIYVGWAPLCKVSTNSKILKPNQRYPHHEKTQFKFEIVAKSSDDKKGKKLQGPEDWNENKVITITGSLECQTENLTEIENGKQLLLREIHREEELAPSDLYDILGLDMEEVRKMKNEDAKKAIGKAFRKQMLIWHPDRNFGDHETAEKISRAKDILMDDEKRARYHNAVDYDKGWLSKKRWKAIFRPNIYTEEQRKAYKRRMWMLVASVSLAVGGIAVSLGTAGAAAPVSVVLGAVLGGGSTGAGLQSLGHTVTKKTILNGTNKKSWFLKAGIGFIGGAVTGGAAAGITAGFVGVGSAAIESGAVTTSQYVGMGSATGAVGGVASSLSSDAAKVIVDKKKVTAKQAVYRAASGGAIGAVAGVVGGLVTKGIVGSQASAANSTLKGDAVEQVSALTGGRRVAHAVAKHVAITGAQGVLRMTSEVVDERLDESAENQKIKEHIQRGIETITVDVLQNSALGFTGYATEEATLDESRNAANNQGQGNDANENQGACNENNEPSNGTFEKQEDDEPEEKMVFKQTSLRGEENNESSNESHSRNVANNRGHTNEANEDQAAGGENNEPSNGTNEEHELEEIFKQSSFKEFIRSCQKITTHVQDEFELSPLDILHAAVAASPEPDEADEPHEATIKYKSKGAWVSKMIVIYYFNGEKFKEEVSGDGKRVHIPADAINIEVKFQVRRPFWGDVMKYDRFQKTWCKPYTPHIFRYEKATDRAFTLNGPLWQETIVRVSDEHHQETKEMS